MSDTPYEHLIVEIKNGVATITINRSEVLNSFNGQTCEELIMAFTRTGWDQEVGVIVLTGAGDRAFCAGGAQSDKAGAYAGARGTVGMPVEEVQSLIRDVPKPVIARVRGYAIGGGNVLAAVAEDSRAARRCDLAGPVALVVGNEGHGVAGDVLEICSGRIGIEQSGRTESLNAAVAAGVLLYEVDRQRRDAKDGPACSN